METEHRCYNGPQGELFRDHKTRVTGVVNSSSQ